jgi:TrfA protein
MAERKQQNAYAGLPPDLAKSMQSLGAAIAARTEREEADRLKQPVQVIQLPIWPGPVRGAPNTFLRSALFSAIQGKTRRAVKNQLLGSTQGVSVKFTGWQLDQSDLDVWEQAMHTARVHPLGNICHFKANAFLKAMGRSNGKKDYVWLHEAITRLVACAVEIRSGKKVFTGSLLSSCIRDEVTGVYKLTLDPDTIQLYGREDWTGVEWEQRQALRGKPLALWLHGFYSSHARPYPIKVDTLRELSGSANKESRDFKRKIKATFADLEAAAGIKGTIVGDFVTVERKPTPAQVRHIVKKGRTPRRP